jgi:5'-methylthioadenosine phosphorylase
MAIIGIIGGSGLNNPDILRDVKELEVNTPYGKPSSPLFCGTLDGKEVAIISRHGKQHQFSPTEVNYRANLHALKEHGVKCIIATTACGSLKEEIRRGDFIILDQFIDFTKHRKSTFHDSFNAGAVHTPMSEPFDRNLRGLLYNSALGLNHTVHEKGTVITIEGPRFSTKAESRMFIGWGADVINMSVATEASLANELKIPYAAIAMSTDYDCWKEDEEPVSWDEILKVFNSNVSKVKHVILETIKKIDLS